MSKTATNELVAADLMQRDVLTIGPNETLRDALLLMTENHVTGLPVMDDHCRCIGLITSSDVLNYEEEHVDESVDGHMLQHFNPELQRWESVPASAFGLEEFGDVRVEEVMTRDLVWVRRDTPVKNVAQRMINQQIHRVLVMDEEFSLYGMISAFDFVRVIAET